MQKEPLLSSFTIGDCGSCCTQAFLPFDFYDHLLATNNSKEISPNLTGAGIGWLVHQISHGTLVNPADETAKYQFMAVVPARDFIVWLGGGAATDDILDMHAL